MPVNSVCETKKSVQKSKFSLSLNRNNAANLGNHIWRSNEIPKENYRPGENNVCDKENKPVKRFLNSTYNNTLNAAKKLKPLSDIPQQVKVLGPEVLLEVLPCLSTAMLNGHHALDSQYVANSQKKTPIATLSNLGNTCFLNSVLYTLRYAPRFLHNLHHLVSDLASVEQKLGSIRLKSSSLGRSAAGLAASGARSWSSKDLLSLGQSDNSTGKSKIQTATEKLHETYLSLRAAESKCLASSADAPDPFAADSFLAALRDVNSTFEGNRQQDAHELLVCILDNVRETCRALAGRAARLRLHANGHSNGLARQSELEAEGKPVLGNLRKSWKKRREPRHRRSSPTEERPPEPEPELDERARPGWDFVAEDFEGTMVVRTMCVECEAVTETSQAVCELCVPVPEPASGATPSGAPPSGAGHEPDPAEPFRAACLSTEYLRDQNKYWCSGCLRHNEAVRAVGYSSLPRLLVLQLKRFSGGMEKITRHAPTPRLLHCFCDHCLRRPKHRYLLWGVIMHLGQSLSGGHYVAYLRSGAAGEPCRRAHHSPPPATSFMRTLFNRPRSQSSGCLAAECCVPRALEGDGGAGGGGDGGEAGGGGWLACDDEQVKPISNEEFDELLSADPNSRSAATPYLLFYVKTEVG